MFCIGTQTLNDRESIIAGDLDVLDLEGEYCCMTGAPMPCH
jgi:hypothetical protein